jgi:tetratricopeptide (TPR) repeat protein
MNPAIAAVVLLALMPPQQQEDAQQKALRLAGEHYDTVMLYRQGEIDAALGRLNTNSHDDQLSIATVVFGIVKQKKADMAALAAGSGSASGRAPAQPRPRPANLTPAAALRWTADLMPAAGALQMEAAILATRRRDEGGYQEAARQINIGELWFEKYTELTGKATPVTRWKLVIGLMTMSHGAFGRAAALLDPECTNAPDDSPLQLACGSAHEAIAMFPGDLTLASSGRVPRLVPEKDIFDDPTTSRLKAVENPVGMARTIRDSHLRKAQSMLDAALKSDPHNVEARIRMANVRTMQREDAKAASLLAPLLLEPVPAREAYLSRMLLSRVKVRAKQYADAVRILDEAAKAMPSGQSAYIGLASVARQQGNAAAVDDALQRMLKAPQVPDDPWVSYRFGQYWVPDRLVRELRTEARK